MLQGPGPIPKRLGQAPDGSVTASASGSELADEQRRFRERKVWILWQKHQKGRVLNLEEDVSKMFQLWLSVKRNNATIG